MTTGRTLRLCTKGHTFSKSSTCPTCPLCEKEKEPVTGFLAYLSNPVRNSLLHHGIDTLEKLSRNSKKEILNLHGIGKASIPILEKLLKEEGLSFKPEQPVQKG
ncbi:RNA polymerase alpha subunit C-terminal domain-containing protein [Sphingobacterium spiritivorum]|uniref:RNA polymerase alpha subunit C-terminal domain-containing protein n=1 Tax=Sphingobacterium spiritivorum TaxID=258 RepID=UPI003DA67376